MLHPRFENIFAMRFSITSVLSKPLDPPCIEAYAGIPQLFYEIRSFQISH